MATGGAWQSEYFDKPTGPASRVEHTAAAPAMGAQATPPQMYHVEQPASKGRGTVIVSVVLRLLTFLFALIALAVLVSVKGTFGVVRGDAPVESKTVRFTVLKALTYLFSACCIVAVYSLAMMAISLISLCAKGLANNKIVLWITFLCDQVLAYVLISAGAAGANAVMASTKDENITGYKGTGPTCDYLGITGFCNKAGASVGLAFAAFLFLAITSILSSRRLFRH